MRKTFFPTAILYNNQAFIKDDGMKILRHQEKSSMEETLTNWFGDEHPLTLIQMVLRGLAVSVIAIVLLRLSGRRSFGLGMPSDNFVAILLGAILARAVVGSSPFWSVILTCTGITALHRLIGWLSVKLPSLGNLIEGKKILLYENNQMIKKNLARALTSEEEVIHGVRAATQSEDLNDISRIYMERNGEITIVKRLRCKVIGNR